MRAFLKQPWAIIALLAWFLGSFVFGDMVNQMYWNLRFIVGRQAADPSIVIVTVRDADKMHGRSWSQDDDANLLQAVAAQHPEQIYFDPRTFEPAEPRLRQEIESLGPRLTYVVRGTYRMYRLLPFQISSELTGRSTKVAASAWQTNLWQFVLESPLAFDQGGRKLPSFSAALAGVPTSDAGSFSPDFRINPGTIPTLTARQVLATSRAGELAGKTVVVSHVRNAPDQLLGYYGSAWIDPVYVDVAAANALRNGVFRQVSGIWLVGLFLLVIFGVRRLKARWRIAVYTVTVAALIVLPVLFQAVGYWSSIQESFFAALVFAAMRLWSKWRRKVRETSQSGLPNFVALVHESGIGEGDLVVGVIARYEEFLASIAPELHGECARQIARRFAVGCGERTIYHGEGGFFAWCEPARSAEDQIEHLEGMRALFAAPLLVGGHMFDTNVHFGLDRNHKLDAQSRVNTALASASEALRGSRAVELFQSDRLANAAWELSLLARIDEGLRNGDIWVAYQPQWDYREARVCGAEALIRWNDPVRGPIRPDEFIVQAERAGRIDALTYFVLEQAIGAAQEFNALGPRFQTSINLSAQMVDKPGLVSSVREIVRRRGIDCRLLTIEVTETAAMRDRIAGVRNLQQLQQMGFRLSIDDFGTGEASLLYLAELPSDELKLDRAFVSRIVHHERERHIVSSAVQLAHALGQTVVAEGIEDIATFELLRKLGCDVGQGYYIGRPETLAQLRARDLSGRQALRGSA
jgi:EAL domain-containing protein (putative c-di-GMP-specific phosphodiesterase class I)